MVEGRNKDGATKKVVKLPMIHQFLFFFLIHSHLKNNQIGKNPQMPLKLLEFRTFGIFATKKPSLSKTMCIPMMNSGSS